MSTHSFHPQGPITTKWWEGSSGACASLEFDDCRIDLFAREGTKIEQLERAIKAFSRELEREPVTQAAE
jgi:hypothetical protein